MRVGGSREKKELCRRLGRQEADSCHISQVSYFRHAMLAQDLTGE